MQNNVIMTTILSLSLFSMNVTAGSNMACTDGVCYIQLGQVNKAIHVDTNFMQISERLRAIADENTIILAPEKYRMTQAEADENALTELQDQLNIDLFNDELPQSDAYCEGDTKPLYHFDETYECV